MSIAALFRQLASLWHYDAGSERVEQLTAELAMRLTATGGLACVSLMRLEAVRRLYGLACFLAIHGITLRRRTRKDRTASFIYAELAPERGAAS
jgi:hypothetical protein